MALILRTRHARGLKVAAIALLAVPIAMLSAFAIGETAGGDWSGLQHVAQVVPLLLLLAAAWRFPVRAGAVLLVLAAVFFGGWLFFAWNHLGAWTMVLTSLLLFAPAFVAGWLLVSAGRAEHAR